jgi:hypothetical protein
MRKIKPFMLKIKFYPFIFLIFCLSACQSIAIHYFGKFDTPTKYVQVYYTTPSLNDRYKIIGIAMVNDTENVFSQQMLDKIVKKAKSIGANAIAVNWHSTPEAWYNPAMWDGYSRGVGAPPSSWGGETFYVHHRVNNYILNISVTFLRKINNRGLK